MRIFLTTCFLILLQSFIYSQQFQLEATVDRNIDNIFDIDGDGICEYTADTNKVYDGSTHNLKYTLPEGFYIESNEDHAPNPYSVFPHIDFNSDGIRDLIIDSYTSQSNPVKKIEIYDVVNNAVLFEFIPPETYCNFKDLIDIDGDGELELVINTELGIYPNVTYRAFIYSTGLSTSEAENDIYSSRPEEYRLKQNFPNPFNPSTTIQYSISTPEKISIKIYSVSGQLVKEINKEHNQPGEYNVTWDGTDNFGKRVSSGVYFYQLALGNSSQAKKMMLIK